MTFIKKLVVKDGQYLKKLVRMIVVLFSAFASLYWQWPGLYGDDGLRYLEYMGRRVALSIEKVASKPGNAAFVPSCASHEDFASVGGKQIGNEMLRQLSDAHARRGPAGTSHI